MKLIFILVAIYGLAYAEEHPGDKVVQLCGAELAKAVQRVCEEGDVEFLNLQLVEHNHQHNHQHDHQHDGHDHHHEAHEHQRDPHSKSQAMKRDTTSSLADLCCSKPCHIKDFLSYCPSV